MSNQTKQLTVADLEAAKKYMEACEKSDKEVSEKNLIAKLDHVAATCIGIVEEMVKCVKPSREVCSPYRCSEMCEDTTFDLQDDSGWEVGQKFLYREDAEHLVALHNLWLKAVAAFGGEVK